MAISKMYHRLIDWDYYDSLIKPTREQMSDIVFDPQFEKAEKCHDWRNHIDEWMQKCWMSLQTETRVCMWLVAQLAADSEEWE